MKRNNIYILITIFILLLTIIYIKKFSLEIENILKKNIKNDSYYIMNQIIDKTIKELINKQSYNDIIEIKDNNTTNINFNNDKINETITNISNKLYEYLQKNNKNEKIYYISYGLLYDNHLLNNLGPQIPYSVKLLGNINTNYDIKIKEYGINNSLIEVVINIKVDYEVILPFVENIYTLEKEIILDSKIISNDIPLYYSKNT